jgi:dTMP kinase
LSATVRGLFITLEGIDGAGKSTHLDWLAEHFRRSGRDVVTTREPGGTPIGEALRDVLLRSDYPLHAETEALIVFAARREHLERVIIPGLEAGQVVLCDRFTDATFAYQGGGRGVSEEKLAQLEHWVQGALQPDLTLLFDVPVDVGRQRLGENRLLDRFEREKGEFYERVRACYGKRAARYPDRIRIIDSSLELKDIQQKLQEIVSTY